MLASTWYFGFHILSLEPRGLGLEWVMRLQAPDGFNDRLQQEKYLAVIG